MSGNVFRLSSEQLPCARCGADDVIMTGKMPVSDAFGQPIVLQLCPHCDTGPSAAGDVLRFFLDGGGKDASRAAEAAGLVFAWQKEAMAAHGYQWVTTAQAPETGFPSHRGPSPRGRG